MTDAFTTIMQNVTEPSEGGWSDDPRDPGGATNGGVTMPDLIRFSRRATVADLRALTQAERRAIFYALYWLPVCGPQMPAPIACMTFDHGVNAGIGDSARLLQAAVGVDTDGWIGPQTLAAVNAANALALVGKLHAAQLADYQSKADAATFINGWTARLELRTRVALTL